ncbi:hypothetical protein P872_02305 [Rhodonellum psychrophilum GCM71 = DSM 17998]|uniref:Exonuclease domain-containing protein n=2 Tax=Rhodonellum TaxID=336827 RepID=U5C6S0_9BACT|nr:MULTISPECIES: 3'-5' exonuclease [Rhodonellum]ERM83872.1 hypothetical protein P872_02305 [Rhodonellum psychrophilum GCM71 = DSM 17998]MDO9554355.1 3'-5' exonuclease [Rhodonellum sp.]SDY67193.1 DNA polymerase III, epsilon subunit [Rhodonellum ikkaensis]
MGWLDFFGKKESAKAGFVKDYEALFVKGIPRMRPISQLNFIVLDTETTGLQPKTDYILSFGAVKVRGYTISVQSALEIYLNAPLQNRESMKVHEIMHSHEAFSLQDFAKDMLGFIGTDILVGHHIGFDIAMLEKALKPFGLKKLLNPLIDTKDLAVRLEMGPNYDTRYGKPGEFSLDELCGRYHISLDDRHTAAGDAFLTAQLLLKLLKIAEQKGIQDYGALMR